MSLLNASDRRLRLIARIVELPEGKLAELESVAGLETFALPESARQDRDWPHAPTHRLSESGTYIVTAGTYQKAHYFRGAQRLDFLEAALLSEAVLAGWQLEAWAVFANHYHFIAHQSPDSAKLADWIAALHTKTSRHANQCDDVSGRQVWHNYWETLLDIETCYLTRLNYVHQNAVKHRLVSVARDYPWCSASWFERTAKPAQVRTIYRFKTDLVKVLDEFDPV